MAYFFPSSSLLGLFFFLLLHSLAVAVGWIKSLLTCPYLYSSIMASTIQDCASLSAAERRQRRKDRILGSADARLEKVIPGTIIMPSFDGEAISARELLLNYSMASQDLTFKSAKEFINSSMASQDRTFKSAKELLSTSSASEYETCQDMTFKTALSTSIAGEDESCEQTLNKTQEIDFVKPSYMDLIDIKRVQACIAAGALLRILTFFHVINRVLPFWLPISISYHSYLLYQVEKKFPKHGYIVNFLLVGGMNEKLVRYLGLTIDVLWSFSMDTMIMAFGFIVVHVLLFLL